MNRNSISVQSGADAPERIYGWLNTHLSVARFYGGIQYNGRMYLIDMGDPQQPLVRDDVLKREAKERKTKEPPSTQLDEAALATAIERGTQAWRDVPDAGAWVDELRGNGTDEGGAR